MSASIDKANPAEYVTTAMRGRLDELGVLIRTVRLQHNRDDVEKLGELGVELEGGDPLEDQAVQLLDGCPQYVVATTIFEIVLGTGGPDDRIVLECGACDPLEAEGRQGAPGEIVYEIRRILYRYSWGGSAERVLSGTDYEVAECFARHVVPELAE